MRTKHYLMNYRMRKWIRPTRTEWVSHIAVVPVLSLVLNLMLFGGRLWHDADIWLYSYPLVCLVETVSWYLRIAVMHWLRQKYADINDTSIRLTILAMAHIGITALSFSVLFFGYALTNFLGYELVLENFKLSLLLSLALTMICTTLWESDHTFSQLKERLAEKERMRQLTLKQEFETLKGQVNPHFLFNCFNALSSLISEDSRQAEVFLNELSKVYRYLLRNNTDGLSTLENEIRFIRSYYELLKTRYGDGLQLYIETDKQYDQYVLPSLTLQMLVENAVKHNVVLKSRPLIIDIFTTAGNILIVNNNLQPRQTKKTSTSTKVGLDNIRQKYALINQSGFQVLEDAKNFSVVLPLTWSPVLENHILSREKQFPDKQIH
jgi:two-component system LytT family sensor kinase